MRPGSRNSRGCLPNSDSITYQPPIRWWGARLRRSLGRRNHGTPSAGRVFKVETRTLGGGAEEVGGHAVLNEELRAFEESLAGRVTVVPEQFAAVSERRAVEV